MNNLKLSFTQSAPKLAQMDIPSINACASYSYGYSSVHRQLAKARAQREGRLEVSEADVAGTAIEACKAYLSQLEQQAATARSAKSDPNAPAESYQA